MSLSLTRVSSRAYAARHKALVRLLSGVLPYYLVNEFPKSGGSWLAEMLSEALDVPFRRNRPIRLERSVTHGHFLIPQGLQNVVVLWRDPRDIMVSLYHHCYFINEYNNRALVELMKARLPFEDYADIGANLPVFIRFISTTPSAPRFTWVQFAENWANRRDVVHTRYEALRADAPKELSRIVRELIGAELPAARAEAIADRHSFDRARQRAADIRASGMEMPFVREGSVGGWQRHFTPEATAEMASYRDGIGSSVMQSSMPRPSCLHEPKQRRSHPGRRRTAVLGILP